MNPYSEIFDHGQEHLKALRLEAQVLSLQPKQPSIRRRIAKILKILARKLEQEPQLAHS
jgi:hypothetical protein